MNLQADEGLKSACKAVEDKARAQGVFEVWGKNLSRWLEGYRNASMAERMTEAFQRRLWDENPVSATGQGNIRMDRVLGNDEERKWLVERLGEAVPLDRQARRIHVQETLDDVMARVAPLCRSRPQLKLFRVMATAFPEDFTTIADVGKLRKLHRAMFGGRRKLTNAQRHFDIVDRLEEVLGPAGEDVDALARRMILPWLMYEYIIAKDEPTPTDEVVDGLGATRLKPLPAARRRRGLTSIRGGFQTLLAVLDGVGDGVKREDLMEHLRSLLPTYKSSSLSVVLNTVMSEFGAIERDGDLLVLTPRGEAALESGDASDLADWLLTRVLGVDMAIHALRDGPVPGPELGARIKACNPGWTSYYMPGAILNWLRSLGVIEDDGADGQRLTEAGQAWAEQIHWTPESLQPTEPVEVGTTTDELPQSTGVELPSLDTIVAAVQAGGRQFDTRTVRDLHAGLWSHPVRHFAVLTGLSGTGKTLLAATYGEALAQNGTSRVHVVTVQPGWHDPGALLGYRNPLASEEYVRSPFLEFLLEASDSPNEPFVVVLDELNLSHPEQYLAPLLSAMETGGKIHLHGESDAFDGVPAAIPYPPNLVIIGTVNMDETTHGLSDKVLDRAYTLEFWDVDLDAYQGWESEGLGSGELTHVRTVLSDLYKALRPARMHFGWRTVETVLRFVSRCRPGSNGELGDVLDSVVYAKILPKLRGDDSPRFLVALDETLNVLDAHGLTRSSQRVDELRSDLKATGTARFWR